MVCQIFNTSHMHLDHSPAFFLIKISSVSKTSGERKGSDGPVLNTNLLPKFLSFFSLKLTWPERRRDLNRV